MGKRFAILIGVAALGAAVIAAGASADFRSVDDPWGDTRCVRGHRPARAAADGAERLFPGGAGRREWLCFDSKRTRRLRRNADIVRATAGDNGTRLKHTIRVVGKFKSVYLLLNTDWDGECEWRLFVTWRERVWGARCGSGLWPGQIWPARVDVHFHSVEISFSKSSIGLRTTYGWKGHTFLGDTRATALDYVPNGFHYIEHSLG